MLQSEIPVLGFAAFSGTGKTTLLKQLLPLLKEQGVHVGMIKHTHHNFDIDRPGKDSYELRKAGAEQMLIASGRRWALMVETETHDGDPVLQEMVNKLDQSKLDLILVEGFKHERFPKIELHRAVLEKPFLYPVDPSIIAIASDSDREQDLSLPHLDLGDTQQISAFILDWLETQRATERGPRS